MKNFFSNKYFLFFAVVLIFSLLWAKSYLILDPDFGYRIRAGEVYLKKGIPETDIFTYTMPSFPWVDHAYLQSTAFHLLNENIGRVGLAFLMAGVSYFALLIAASSKKLKVVSNFGLRRDLPLSPFKGVLSFPFWLGAALLASYIGIRVQVVSWLLLSIFLLVRLDKKLWQRLKNFSPFYFLLWANLHGGFASGLSAWAIIIFARFWRKRNLNFRELFLFTLSISVTLLNPYGVELWREVYSSVSDTALRFRIAEWMPSIFVFDLSMAALFTLSASFIIKYKDKFSPEEKLLYFLFLLQGIASRRHLPLWVIVSVPMLVKSMNLIYKEAGRIRKGKERFLLLYKYALFGSILIFLIQSGTSLWGASYVREGSFYPDEGASYLQNNIPAGNIFSSYNWGGYLIWKLPEKKVFVDGRMPSWSWDAPPGEEDSAFRTYGEIMSGDTDYGSYFDKYGIDVVFLPKEKEKGLYFYLQQKLEKILVRFGRGKEGSFNLLNRLEEDGWEKVHEDDLSVIFERNS